MKLLFEYTQIKSEIKILENDLKYYSDLLKSEDLINFDFLESKEVISHYHLIFSPVEKEVFSTEKKIKMNHEFIKKLILEIKTKIRIRKNKINRVDMSLLLLSKEDRFLIECRFFDRMKYKDISKNFESKFRFSYTENTIKNKINKSIKKIDRMIESIYKN